MGELQRALGFSYPRGPGARGPENRRGRPPEAVPRDRKSLKGRATSAERPTNPIQQRLGRQGLRNMPPREPRNASKAEGRNDATSSADWPPRGASPRRGSRDREDSKIEVSPEFGGDYLHRALSRNPVRRQAEMWPGERRRLFWRRASDRCGWQLGGNLIEALNVGKLKHVLMAPRGVASEPPADAPRGFPRETHSEAFSKRY